MADQTCRALASDSRIDPTEAEAARSGQCFSKRELCSLRDGLIGPPKMVMGPRLAQRTPKGAGEVRLMHR